MRITDERAARLIAMGEEEGADPLLVSMALAEAVPDLLADRADARAKIKADRADFDAQLREAFDSCARAERAARGAESRIAEVERQAIERCLSAGDGKPAPAYRVEGDIAATVQTLHTSPGAIIADVFPDEDVAHAMPMSGGGGGRAYCGALLSTEDYARSVKVTIDGAGWDSCVSWMSSRQVRITWVRESEVGGDGKPRLTAWRNCGDGVFRERVRVDGGRGSVRAGVNDFYITTPDGERIECEYIVGSNAEKRADTAAARYYTIEEVG